MKKLKWFKSGEDIPDGGRYIKSESVKENMKQSNCDCPSFGTCNCWDYDLVEYHLYEVGEQVKAIKELEP